MQLPSTPTLPTADLQPTELARIASALEEVASRTEPSLLQNPDFYVAAFTGILAVVTAVLAVYTYRLWSSGRDATRHRLRAYVTVNSYAIDPLANDEGIFASAHVRNLGQTPARNVRSSISMRLAPDPLPEVLANAELHENAGSSRTTIGSGTFTHIEVTKKLDKDDFAEITGGRGVRAAYVFGKVTYEDVFGEKHSTCFCYGIEWDTEKKRARPFFTAHGNEAS